MSDVRQILARTALAFCDPQGGRLKFVVHLVFREFLGREIRRNLNRGRIILESQVERPSAVFVFGVLHVAGYRPVGNIHGADIIKIGSFVRQKGSEHEDGPTSRWRAPSGFRLHLVPARLQRPTGEFHDRPDPMGGVRWDCGGGGNRAIVRYEETDVEGLGTGKARYVLASTCLSKYVRRAQVTHRLPVGI